MNSAVIAHAVEDPRGVRRGNYKLFALPCASQEVKMDDNEGFDPGKVAKKTCISVV